jgi:hypothetical protein
MSGPIRGRGEARDEGISDMELERGKEKERGLLGVGVGHQFQLRS